MPIGFIANLLQKTEFGYISRSLSLNSSLFASRDRKSTLSLTFSRYDPQARQSF